MGVEVEQVARHLFPPGLLVNGTQTEAQQLFQHEQLLAAVDVLEHDTETGGVLNL